MILRVASQVSAMGLIRTAHTLAALRSRIRGTAARARAGTPEAPDRG